jgi:hypothetical protein
VAISEQRTLRKLRDKLRSDYVLLVQGMSVDVERDDGTRIRQEIPGLIRQLASAIGRDTDSEIAKIRRSKGTLPSVISVQAFDIMSNIERVTRNWDRAHNVTLRITNSVESVCRGSVNDIGNMRIMSHYLDSWVRLITELFDPPRRIHLAGACPECGQSRVRQFNMDDQEYVIAPALQIIQGPNGHICECLSCGTQWPNTHFLLLAKVLGCESVS